MLRLDYDPKTGDADLGVDSFGGLADDGGVQTLGLTALLYDARPGAQDVQADPAGAAAQRIGGWWASSLLPPDTRPERPPGSLLHRLTAYKANAATARRAERWATQALEWMTAQGLADRVAAEASVGSWSLTLEVTAYRGGGLLFRQIWSSST